MSVNKVQGLLRRNALQLSAIAAVILLLLVSHAFRASDISGNVGIQNLETPWHAILTIQAMSESDLGTHRFLPIVTLGGPHNKGIPWGASNPDSRGNYFYTSATAPTFVLPYVWMRVFGLEPTIQSLAGFSFALQVASVLLLYAFLHALLRAADTPPGPAAFASVIASAISIFSREALVAFGVVYWFHGIYQILLIAALCFILRALTKPEALRPWMLALFTFICFLGAWVEWTGFAFNVGGAVVLLAFQWSREAIISGASIVASSIVSAALLAIHRSKATMLTAGCMVGSALVASLILVYRGARVRTLLAGCMLLGTFLAASVIVAHYATILDLPTFTWRLRARFEARSPLAHGGVADNVLLLAQGYTLSFGLFLLVVAAGGLMLSKAQMRPKTKQLVWPMVILSAVPLAENIIVMENSAEFSYARIKFAVPAAVVIAIAIAYGPIWGRIAITAGVVAASIFGCWSYKKDLTYYARWEAIDRSNKTLRDRLVREPGFECSVLVTNTITRGYGTMIFHRMIFEPWAFTGATDKQDYLRQAMARTGACKGIYLEGKVPNNHPPLTNMPEYLNALIMDKDGASRLLSADTVPEATGPQSWYVRLFSHQGRDILARWRGSH